jgi:hypothetical protein
MLQNQEFFQSGEWPRYRDYFFDFSGGNEVFGIAPGDP